MDKAYYLSDEPVPFALQATRSLLDFICSSFSPSETALSTQLLQAITTNITPIQPDQIPAGERTSLILPVLNYPRVHDPEFLKKLTPFIVSQVNEGRLSLFFDHCNESNSERAIETFAARLGEQGITNFSAINWICHNSLLPDVVYGVRHIKFNCHHIQTYVNLAISLPAHAWCETRLASKYLNAITKPRLLCLNSTPRPERIAAILQLVDLGIIKCRDYDPHHIPNLPYLSFGGFDSEKGGACTVDESREWLVQHNLTRLIPHLEWLSDKVLAVDSFTEKGGNLICKIDLDVYSKTILSFVTETTMAADLKHITEKTLKPLMLGHPIVVAGTRGSLELARELGFGVLDHVINPSYDLESDLGNRIWMSTNEVMNFMNLTAGNLSLAKDEIIPHLQANLKWAQTSLPLVFQRQRVEPLLNRVFGIS